ncbi:MAG: asparagine synthase (glutamine-hydrolyzing) [Nanoarchaeota archaeon]|nr:asparagine synthase (glutamine-hydrolyzing) [Nanoarchaeota archaeon]
MCGICGFNWEDKKLVREMVSILQHRGPDQNGFLTDSSFSFGHTRLSIIDLSTKGKQPMSNEENTIWVVFNGEIYNFMSLREELEGKGHKFKSNTDTEVIIHAYEEYGEACVSLFNGMFAFSLWDARKKQFFIARDRSGIKPLYYSLKNGKLIFASEIKALLLCEHIRRNISPESFYNFLTFRYTPGTQTIFRDIQKLSPGNYMTYNTKTSKLSIKNYWNLKLRPKRKSTSDYSKELNNTLLESINKRLISDVPLGAFLSGGLDSTYVVALMSQLTDQPVKTFSVGFDAGEGYDESKFARFVADTYQTDHHEIFVKEKSFNLLPKVLWHMDEPIADFASIPTYILSEFAKKKVSVVLTGEGADEIFGGYKKYRYLRAFHPYHKAMPLNIREIISQVGGIFNKSLFFDRMKDFHSAKTVPEYYLQLISFFTLNEKKNLCTKDILSKIDNRPDIETVKPFFNKGPIINSLMTLDFRTWLPEDLLMKVDKTTMAHALEARVPFLDPNMVNLSSQIPSNLKIRLNKEKYILRKAMKKAVPKKIYTRKKHGFNVPIHKWLSEDLKDISLGLLSEKSMKKRGMFNYRYIEKMFNNYNKSKIYYSRQLWTLLNFEIWARIYLDKNNIKKSNIKFDNILGG